MTTAISGIRVKIVDERFDLVVIGTPPRALLIEKPLGTPDLAGCDQLRDQARAAGTRLLVASHHRLTQHTRVAAEWLTGHAPGLGALTTLRTLFREHWGGIFKAHLWPSAPADTCLGFTERGGGAIGEHSHGINIWQYFAELTGHGRITEVSAQLDRVERDGVAYDRIV